MFSPRRNDDFLKKKQYFTTSLSGPPGCFCCPCRCWCPGAVDAVDAVDAVGAVGSFGYLG